jgi:putative transposase
MPFDEGGLDVRPVTRAPEIGPACVSFDALENGSKERIDEGSTSRAGAGRSQAQGGRQAAGRGGELPEVLKQLEVSVATYHRWRAQYDGMKADDVKRLKELETENAKLKRIVANQMLDIEGLNELARGNV